MSEKLPAEQRVVELARDLIRIPSLTPVSSELRAAARESLTFLKAFLEQAGAHCELLTFEGGHQVWSYPVDNLYAEWRSEQSGPSLCFMGHTDVVAPGDLNAWSQEPYGGAIENGLLYGRGATDMKGAVAAFAVAAADLARDTIQAGPTGRVSLIITSDEEWAAINGTRRVLDWMKANGRAPSAFVVGEPSSEELLGSAIKIGRRGSLCGTLNAAGVQGHAAYQGLFENPNRGLALALAILNAHRWYDAEPGMPATNFETIATQSGDFGATAIIPGEARALWNIRFTPHETPLTLAHKLQELLDYPPQWAKHHPDARLLHQIRLIANSDTASMPYYSPAGVLAPLARSVVFSRAGRQPALDAKGGTTDGRFIHEFFPQAEVIELGLPECGGLTRAAHSEIFGERGGMHQVDESCSIHDLQTLMWCYRDLLSAYLGMKQ